MYFIDKRVVQSREIIVKALIQLDKDSIKNVKINELCKKAGVSRTTFYRHQSSIEELLVNYLHDWYYITFDELFSDEDINYDLFLQFFKACKKELKFFNVIYRYKLDHEIMTELQKYSDKAIQKNFERDESIRNSPFFKNYSFSLYAFMGVIHMSIKYWIDNDTLTAKEISDMVQVYHNWISK